MLTTMVYMELITSIKHPSITAKVTGVVFLLGMFSSVILQAQLICTIPTFFVLYPYASFNIFLVFSSFLSLLSLLIILILTPSVNEVFSRFSCLLGSLPSLYFFSKDYFLKVFKAFVNLIILTSACRCSMF